MTVLYNLYLIGYVPTYFPHNHHFSPAKVKANKLAKVYTRISQGLT